ncbi:MAG: hypothetical protein IJQ26_07280, partial [Lachnospiraceae bacterium]|nr:hypothetical protein [Lachnospiraceae bacterium]
MKRKLGTCIVSLLMTAVMVWHAPLMALAVDYYIDYGNITITAGPSRHSSPPSSSRSPACRFSGAERSLCTFRFS